MSVISCKVDDDLKRGAENIFSALGLSMSAAINMFLKASVRENGLPISTKLKTYEEILSERLQESENPKNMSPVFDNLKDAKEWLDA